MSSYAQYLPPTPVDEVRQPQATRLDNASPILQSIPGCGQCCRMPATPLQLTSQDRRRGRCGRGYRLRATRSAPRPSPHAGRAEHVGSGGHGSALRGTAVQRQPVDPLTADIDKQYPAGVVRRGAAGWKARWCSAAGPATDGLGRNSSPWRRRSRQASRRTAMAGSRCRSRRRRCSPATISAGQPGAVRNQSACSEPAPCHPQPRRQERLRGRPGRRLRLQHRLASADIGSSPVGFREQRLVGGVIEFAPQADEQPDASRARRAQVGHRQPAFLSPVSGISLSGRELGWRDAEPRPCAARGQRSVIVHLLCGCRRWRVPGRRAR